jgi:hypothetical protein
MLTTPEVHAISSQFTNGHQLIILTVPLERLNEFVTSPCPLKEPLELCAQCFDRIDQPAYSISPVESLELLSNHFLSRPCIKIHNCISVVNIYTFCATSDPDRNK